MSKNTLVLNIDDDPNVNILLKTIMKLNQIDLVSTTTPEDFLDKLKTLKPALCLVDLNLEVGLGAGLQLIKAIRNQLGNELPLIIVSKRNSKEDISNALELGATDYITKPIDDMVLLSRLKLHLASIESSELPLYKVSDNKSECNITTDCWISKVNEFGLTIKSKNLIRKGTFIELDGSIVNEMTGHQRGLKGIISKSIYDPATRDFSSSFEFDSSNTDLIYQIRQWMQQQD